jgi:enoyl-CoA hydratase/carnithine racemase
VEDFETLVVTTPRPGVLLARLDRPQRRNAITFRMFEEFRLLCARVRADPDVRVLVLTGAGAGFCAGLDLSDAQTLPGMTALEMLHGQEGWAEAIVGFRLLDRPVIAAVNGAAAGAGFSLALAADIRLAAPQARFNAAFVKIGLSGGDCGSSWLLPRIVGLGLASEILLTGRFVEAQEALRMGLINRIVPAEQLLEAAFDLAEQIAANSPLGVRLTKAAVQANVDAPSLAAALELENRNQVLASRTADMTEALDAFLGKRPPVFTAR